MPEASSLPTKTSRLLDAAAKKRQSRQAVRRTAISYKKLVEGVSEDVL